MGCKTKNKIAQVVINSVFLLAFIFPVKLINNYFGVEIDKYIFLIVCVIANCLYTWKKHSINKKEIIFFGLIFLVCLLKSSVEPLMLLEIPFLYKLARSEKTSLRIKDSVLVLSLVGVFVYSIIYASSIGSYLCTGLAERNISGELIFMLFLIIYNRSKKVGRILLPLGVLTLSRNYILCLLVFVMMSLKMNLKIYKYFSFRNLTIASIIMLSALSMSFEYAYSNDGISETYEDVRKYVYIYDYSNYFRFTANTNLLKIYKKYPNYILAGMSEKEFMDKNLEIAIDEDKPYRAIKPHNYFFSYLRIYGIFSIFIFMMTGAIFNKIANKKNKMILFIIFLYANILGVGLSNYFMYLSSSLMVEYEGGKDDETTE